MARSLFSWLKGSKTSRREAPNRQTSRGFRPTMEALEVRDMLSVTTPYMSGDTWVVPTDNAATSLELSPGWYSNYVLTEMIPGTSQTTGRFWTMPVSAVARVEFHGGAGDDSFVNNAALALYGYGGGGNDYMQGSYLTALTDYLYGEDGNDTLWGFGGNDNLYGQNGNDEIRGFGGNDKLKGGSGDDRLNGGAGADWHYGEDGDDVLIAIDDTASDSVAGGSGSDIVWVDKTSTATTDGVYYNEAADKVQYVEYFANYANGADKTLDGDDLTDPTTMGGYGYKEFANKRLFSSAGPRYTDIHQGDLGDCWLLSGLGAIANDNPHVLRQNIVDFGDGTYGVRLYDEFYRVDNDLPVDAKGKLAYALLGAENSIWVAIAEKAAATRGIFPGAGSTPNRYDSIDGGKANDVNKAFGAPAIGVTSFNQTVGTDPTYRTKTDFAKDLFNRWNNYEAVTIGLTATTSGLTTPEKMYTGHVYTLVGLSGIEDATAGWIAKTITIYNPHGKDGGGPAGDTNTNDGLITLSVDYLYDNYCGQVLWGKV